MSLAKYEPMNFLNRIQSELNDFYKLNGHRLTAPIFEQPNALFPSEWQPTVDVKETRRQFKIVVDIPGVEPKDIEVSMENDCLTVRGERKEETEKEEENRHIKECSYGVFERRFRLPDTADGKKITAKGTNGVLTITVGKKKASNPKRIAVSS